MLVRLRADGQDCPSNLWAGGTRRHSLVGTNTARALENMGEGHDCLTHGSDMQVHLQATGYRAHLDVSVDCPPIEGDEDDEISNPLLVVEVLSPSTADFDRGANFGHYRKIPSLQEYLVSWQDEPRAEQHTRTEDGLWLLRQVVGIDQTLQLAARNESGERRGVSPMARASHCA